MSEAVDATRFTGRVLRPGDDGFEQARVGRVFNARRPARLPAAVLLAETEQDLVEGVRLAAERGWRVSVRSGGHSWAAWSVRDDALLIDLGGYRALGYDPDTRIATATPSVQGGDELNPFLAGYGRFFPGGHCPSVGIGGFLLQGGQGWNARGWGWAAEQIVALDVVTAQGELVRADAERNSDLFWAARGAGPGFFGLVTRFHLRTRPLPKALAHTAHVYPAALFDEVMTWLHDTHAQISTDVEIVACSQIPPGETAPVLVVSGVAFCDTPEAAQAALAPFGGCPVLDRALFRQDAAPTTFAEQRAIQVAANPAGHRYVVDCAWLTGPSGDVVPAIRGLFTDLPAPKAFTIWFSMAPLRPLPDMAFSLQSEIYCASYVVYEDEADDARHRAWLDRRMAELEPVTVGQYLGDSDLANRQLKVLSTRNWARLQEIRAERDPDGRFVGYLAATDVPTNANHWQSG